MIKEKSCGAVIFLKDSSPRRYLILHSVQGHWTLCKGHVEKDETELQTASREIKEETGLTVTFIEGFRQQVTYQPHVGVDKDVIFFLALTANDQVVCQPEEVKEIVFLELNQALQRLTHQSDKDVLSAADQFIQASSHQSN
jgi:bis(5'-nucleosidyl)-tetraphosphatase